MTKEDNHLDVNILENWLNNTLKEAEGYGLPGIIKRDIKGAGVGGGKCAYCIDYGIDRLTLNNTGINNRTIDVLYRTFFINTAGFYRSLEDAISEQANEIKMKYGSVAGVK